MTKCPLDKTRFTYIGDTSVYNGAGVKKLDIFFFFKLFKQRDLGKIQGLALLFSQNEAEITHYKIEQDIDGQCDRDILDEGEKEPGYKKVRNEKAHDDTDEAAEDDLKRYVFKLGLDLQDSISEDEAA